MKASSILSIATLAVSALATPILNNLSGATSVVDDVVEKVGVVGGSGDIVTLLEGTLKGVKEHTGAMSKFFPSPKLPRRSVT